MGQVLRRAADPSMETCRIRLVSGTKRRLRPARRFSAGDDRGKSRWPVDFGRNRPAPIESFADVRRTTFDVVGGVATSTWPSKPHVSADETQAADSLVDGLLVGGSASRTRWWSIDHVFDSGHQAVSRGSRDDHVVRPSEPGGGIRLRPAAGDEDRGGSARWMSRSRRSTEERTNGLRA